MIGRRERELPAMPARFADNPDFARLWAEVALPLRGRIGPEHGVEVEAAVMLLADLRHADPGWPTERYLALADLMARLRGG